MRIYELAQKLNTTSAALLRRASELDLEITTAISSVSADDEAALRTGLMPPTIEEAAKRRETREAKAAEAARKTAARRRKPRRPKAIRSMRAAAPAFAGTMAQSPPQRTQPRA